MLKARLRTNCGVNVLQIIEMKGEVKYNIDSSYQEDKVKLSSSVTSETVGSFQEPSEKNKHTIASFLP